MRGFSVLILIIFVGILLAGVSLFFRQSNIKGTNTQAQTSPGFLISIVSDSETWELNLYGCTSESQCERLSKTGGGATELKEIAFSPAPNWSKYESLKLSVITKDFKVLSAGDIPGTKESSNSVTFPVSPVTEAFYRSAVFSDH
jgi:hypothetical protein